MIGKQIGQDKTENKMVVLLFQRIVKEAVAFPQPLIFYIIFFTDD